MRTITRWLSPLALALVAACILPSCRVAGAIGESLPPSEGYVDDLHEGQDKAIAQTRQDLDGAVQKLRADHDEALSDLRTHVDLADTKIRDDAVAADMVSLERFKRELAEGKTFLQVMVGAADEKATRAGTDAASARSAAESIARDTLAAAAKLRDDALAQSKSQTDTALAEQGKVVADAKKKAEEAKAEVADAIADAPSDLEGWGKAGVGLIGALVAGYFGLRRYDSKPFLGANGEPVAEADLVKVARAHLAAASTPKT